MDVIEIHESDRKEYNEVVDHPLQSYEWGEFREKSNVKVIRRGFIENNKLINGFSLTIHKIPKTKLTIGYLPKGNKPTKEMYIELEKIGRDNNCIFIQLEPNILHNSKFNTQNSKLIPSFHPLFTKFTFLLDISKSEEDLLKSFHSKTRYNIRVAQKHNVKVGINDSPDAFENYLKLTSETTSRQKFYAHTLSYHKTMWETLSHNTDGLSAHLLQANYAPEGEKQDVVLASWVLFVFKDTLYYPYGASSSKFRNVMASNLIMWEAIKFGKKLGLEKFDMWGALGVDPNPKDAWYGFHKFKEGYGATHTEFAGSFDLVIKSNSYIAYKIMDKARWIYLRMKKMF